MLMGVAGNETVHLGRRLKKSGYLFLLVQTNGGVMGQLVIDHYIMQTPVERKSTNHTFQPHPSTWEEMSGS